MSVRVEQLAENVKLYCGDCREVLPTLGQFDAVVTDPPYGIGADKGAGKSAKKWSAFTAGERWDTACPDDEMLRQLLGCADHAIIWGGNYYGLPATPCWLIWDKETAGITTFADCEVAWTNLDKAMRLKRHLWSGPYMKVKEERLHPTQKPLTIMQWCVDLLPATALSIVDPYMGSGTTGVAAVSRKRRFSGIELDDRFFDIACRRIADELRRPRLFAEPVQAATQASLFAVPQAAE